MLYLLQIFDIDFIYLHDLYKNKIYKIILLIQVRIQRVGTGGPPPPPEKSQVIWVSIGNKQLDPPPPPPAWKKLDPHLKMLDPL